MKKLLSVLAGVTLFVAPSLAQDSAFRLYLAEEGVDGNTPLGGISPAQVNPNIVDPGGGTQRLYVWAQVLGAEKPQKYISIGYNVRTTGSLVITGASTWNYTSILRRWTETSSGQLGGGTLQDVRLVTNPVGSFGVADNAGPGNSDSQYDPATKSTVIGWIEVTGTGDVFLQVGDVGIIRTNTLGNPFLTWDDVYLGFGDENAGVMGNSFDVGSPIPEATVESGGQPSLSLTTLFARDNGGSLGGAVFFDITVGPNPITITGYDTNTGELVPFGWEVFVTAAGGTSFGNALNPGVWTSVTTGSGQGMGNDNPSPVSINTSFTLAEGTTYGMALVMGPEAGHVYTNGTGANQSYSNADIALSLGQGQNTPFSSPPFMPRVWNGTIYYTVLSCYADCDQSTGFRVLDMFDFLCFQNSFVNSEPYACDCDTSTGNGVCDVFDFLCFLDEFFAGCS